MKKNFLALGLAAMMLALPGCVKDTTNDLTDGAQGELVKHTFKVAMELPQNEDGSRLTLDDENYFVWEDQDQVTIMGSDGKTYVATIDLQGMDGLRLDEGVEFSVSMPEGVIAKYAWRNMTYGTKQSDADVTAGFGNLNGTSEQPTATSATIRMGLYKNQTLASSNLFELVNQLPMIGTIENGCIYMRNIFGIAELRVMGPGRLWSAHIFSKTLSFRGIYGHVSTSSTTPVWGSYNNPQNNASLSPTGMASAQLGGLMLTGDESSSIFFAVPVANGNNFTTSWTHAAGDLGIILRGDVDNGEDFAITKFSGRSHTFARNKVTPMTITYEKPASSETAIDLTELGGDSNCYMVAPQGTDAHYKFRAYDHKGVALAKGNFVVPAWHTINCPVKDIWYEAVEEDAPYIHFTVKGGTQNGSMIVAVASGSEDSHWAKDIYHIWASDAKDQTYGGLTVLDRNIGATYAPKSVDDVKNMDGYKAAETCGFYYQWGRQTPFGSPLTLDGSKSNDTQYGWENGKTSTHGNTNHVYYKALPWTSSGFTAYPNGAAQMKNIDAYKDYMMQSMCCTVAGYEYQWACNLATTVDGTAWAYGAKGLQDPCPQGYRVPTQAEMLKIFRYPTGNTTEWMKYRHWDVVNKQWILAGKYEASEMVEGETNAGAQHEYGGYSQSALTNNNFVWIAYSGIRYGNAAGLTAVSTDVGSLRYGGYSGAARDSDKAGRLYIWSVPSEADMLQNASIKMQASPTHTSNKKADFTGTARMPFAPVLEMVNAGNVYYGNLTLAINNACPVRCVKMEQAEPAL